ncbi:hypothetical protein ACOMHN_015941 [Nucella lapillus]
MYDGIKKALGPVQKDTAPPSPHTHTPRVIQPPPPHTHTHPSNPQTQNTVSPSARDAIPCLPTMDELDADPALDELDADPALDELSKATDSLAAGKAPGSDGIPPDLLKHCKSAVFFHCSKSSVNVGRKAHDAAFTTNTQQELHTLMDCFPQACKDFRLTLSLKKTEVLGQDVEAPPVITIEDYELEQEKRLNVFHLRCICRTLGIALKDEKPNIEVLSRAGLPAMFILLRRCRLHWVEHVHRMEEDRIPKDLFCF